MRRTPSLFSRIQVRAYFFWHNAIAFNELDAWLMAERIELELAANKRSEAARKGALTRAANRAKVKAFDALPVTHVEQVVEFPSGRRFRKAS